MPLPSTWSIIQKKIEAVTTMATTMVEVIQVSRHVVQVILRASARTSLSEGEA